jgi:hypothetical protein
MRIDSSGNVGVGVTPSAWFASNKAIQIGSTGAVSNYTNGSNIQTFLANNVFWNAAGTISYITTNTATSYTQDNGTHKWYYAASGTAGNAITFTQAMTLDASGNLLVGKTSTATTTVGAELRPAGQIISTLSGSTNGSDTLGVYSTGASAYRFYVGMAGTVFATNTTISAISDIRFKENIRPLDVGLAEVMALQPRLYDWKEGKGPDIKNARGFIAQEFETVFPDLIDEWKDPAPEGEEPYKSVRADLIPVLVKAIQEQQALITSLTARIAALEGAQ